MTTFEEYREAEQKLAEIRQKNGGAESSEEDELMDRMDFLWWELSDDERAIINAGRVRL